MSEEQKVEIIKKAKKKKKLYHEHVKKYLPKEVIFKGGRAEAVLDEITDSPYCNDNCPLKKECKQLEQYQDFACRYAGIVVKLTIEVIARLV